MASCFIRLGVLLGMDAHPKPDLALKMRGLSLLAGRCLLYALPGSMLVPGPLAPAVVSF
jgi:hypothetical protein